MNKLPCNTVKKAFLEMPDDVGETKEVIFLIDYQALWAVSELNVDYSFIAEPEDM
jgi:hypothetical protein